ncbi:PTS sugar transporter subunit IIB [Erysipelotrichaceae bacterium Oil+RF-744-GAM-WT-6]|uniref:PTS sugar transporter subunit IIB n=1 Tax=Stecheria intestinalis TaxID=2606630 RepID=A0A7X2THC7_9FIRM|nr:PTS sugar transporter subunit IIB [Stecheria intestinalis]MSS59436.1 PTS sugar transporter subunit IIB [Stecheria intestinalis]
MKIMCVCGMGLGSSLIAKMNVEDILREMGISAEVDNCDLGSVTMHDADLYITTNELAANIPQDFQPKTLVLDNFLSKDSIREKLQSVLNK